MNENYNVLSGEPSYAHLGDSSGRESLISVAEDGFAVTRLRERFREHDRTYESRRLQFEEAMENYRSRPDFHRERRVREALATSDMPLLFTDTSQRTLMAEYEEQAQLD